jgi:hypothetical protein
MQLDSIAVTLKRPIQAQLVLSRSLNLEPICSLQITKEKKKNERREISGSENLRKL